MHTITKKVKSENEGNNDKVDKTMMRARLNRPNMERESHTLKILWQLHACGSGFIALNKILHQHYLHWRCCYGCMKLRTTTALPFGITVIDWWILKSLISGPNFFG